MWYPALITLLVSYMLGNLNGSVCISRLTRDEDVRKKGSGNAGLTNFFRTYGGAATILVAIVDGGKTVLACLAGGLMFAPYGMDKFGMILGGVAITLGHDFPVLLGLQGGKGIMCGFFAVLVTDWRIALVVFCLFSLAYALTGYVSLGSLVGALTYITGFAVVYHDNLPVMLGGVFLGVLAIVMHRKNIVRLIRGEESKVYLFGKGRKA